MNPARRGMRFNSSSHRVITRPEQLEQGSVRGRYRGESMPCPLEMLIP